MAENNPFVILTDRSRTISYQDCPRRRYLGYHFEGLGLASTKLVIPLATGQYTHHGLAMLLQGVPIDEVVKEAIGKYWDEIRRRGIQVDPGEDAAYVADEQCALVEGMLRAYEKVRLPALLEEFEVIETEREELFPMARWQDVDYVGVSCSANCGGWPGSLFDEAHPWPTNCPACNAVTKAGPGAYALKWMARADALLREKCSSDLYVVSYKTAGSWDARKSRENEHDMQGLSEVAAMEYRINTIWNMLHAGAATFNADKLKTENVASPALIDLIAQSPTVPRVSGVKMEFLIKGDRYVQKTEGGRKIQHSPLIRGYQRMNAPTASDPADLGWKREYQDEDGKTRRLDYRTWKSVNVWEQPGGVKAWIDLLHGGIIQPEAGPCLEAQFISPIPYFRNDDDMRDWFEQTAVQERRVAESVQIVEAAIGEYGWHSEEVRSLMNRNFPQHRARCDWPSPCFAIDICFGANVGEDPIASGLYMKREPHHAPEAEKFNG